MKKITLDTVLLLAAQARSLEGLDLSGLDLAGLKLDQVSFARSDLQEADLQRARLREADFSEASLVLASLDEAQAERATFTGDGIRPASAQKANFAFSTWANIAEIRGADFSGASFIAASFGQLRFLNCNFSGCNFNGSTWNEVFTDGCSFAGATFNRADVGGLSGWAHKPHPLKMGADTQGARNYNPFTALDRSQALDRLEALQNRDNPDPVAIAQALDHFRKTVGVTQGQLSEALGVPLRTWTDWQAHPQRMKASAPLEALAFLRSRSGLK